MINETGVFFFPGGGHDHDGQNSSLINVKAYSVFDFEWSTTLGGPDRIRRLDRNYTAFREFIINTVNQSILNPAGIFYQPGSINGSSHIISSSITANEIAANTITADEIAANTITANEIAAGTITGNLLSANVVLVNQVIASNNYVPGVSGWAIDGDGTAEFDAASIRGTLTAAAVSTPGVEIYSNGVLAASNFVIQANGAFGNNNFDVDASGNLTAINADISGEINSTVGTIGGFAIGATSLSATGSQGYLNLNADAGGIELEQGNYFISMYATILYGGFNNVINFVIDPGDGSAAFSGINLTNGISMNTGTVNGDGISYPGCTTGPGTPNNMGLVWNNPDIRGTVDNVVSAVLGTVSDIRFKTNIEDVDEICINKILNDVRVVSYNPVNLLNNSEISSIRRVGIIAQELIDVMPELVDYNPEKPDDYISTNYLGFVPHLVKIVQVLDQKIKNLELQIGEMNG